MKRSVVRKQNVNFFLAPTVQCACTRTVAIVYSLEYLGKVHSFEGGKSHLPLPFNPRCIFLSYKSVSCLTIYITPSPLSSWKNETITYFDCVLLFLFSGHQDKLDTAYSHAAPYEDSVQRLLPWVPDTLSHINSLGACPTEPEAVEKRKKEIEVSREDLKLYMYMRFDLYVNVENIVNNVHVAHVYICSVLVLCICTCTSLSLPLLLSSHISTVVYCCVFVILYPIIIEFCVLCRA